MIRSLPTRDRLLLAFADLGSFGIVAEPAVPGPLPRAVVALNAKTAQRAPFAPRDYVFWLEDEDVAFDSEGKLTDCLVLHLGNSAIVDAVENRLATAGVPDAQQRRSPGAITILPDVTTARKSRASRSTAGAAAPRRLASAGPGAFTAPAGHSSSTPRP